ncbi:type II toxin-antitoxin system RelE family toxin [Idiomarina aminovorans]|uniref:type II toxin-antitoxin system RelE family toxin n=1 Tax=Idiomarina aminovorans TaxID=2914829 RepID=UPI0020068EFE|nr:type II toxin-antitoxin system RelE/ParE family toxin [Idiomarina sp. ATCH4]MCK7458026.1 type II toxin-antitoxin system RelE/ParE family toxin [Idiomarina sp. ATCH4]
MTYKLTFKRSAHKEWKKLNKDVQAQFKARLKQSIELPHVLSSRLKGMDNCYKVKLRKLGYRLMYQVRDSELVITVVAVGKRDKNRVYINAQKRLD